MWIFNYFETLGAVFVIENAYRVWDPVQVPDHVKDPLEYIAWRSFLRNIQWYDLAKQRSGNPVVERNIEYIKDYKIDGVVFHATRSCRATTIGQIHIRNMLHRYVDVPTLQLVSDIVDVRDYSEVEWRKQIDAFVESVDAFKSNQVGA
jgi:hypothetical protein